jgi:hypothetical protein
MRGLSDVAFYRPAKSLRYAQIDALFTGDADWDLIATHARDMIQVVLSIQAGRVMPSMLLRRCQFSLMRRLPLLKDCGDYGEIGVTAFSLICRLWPLMRFCLEPALQLRAATTSKQAP